MSKFRTTLTALGLVVAAAAPVMVTGPPAQAANGSPGCVTRSEYHSIRLGMTPITVKRKFGTGGKVSGTMNANGWRIVLREYQPCNSRYGFVLVSFRSLGNTTARMAQKSAYWS